MHHAREVMHDAARIDTDLYASVSIAVHVAVAYKTAMELERRADTVGIDAAKHLDAWPSDAAATPNPLNGDQ